MATTQVAAEPRYLQLRNTRIRRFTRGEFLRHRWRYRPGQHVSFIAPTQDGKTTLAFQLMQVTASPELPGTVAVMKPRDPTPAAWGKYLGFPEVATWPPRKPRPWEEKPGGYVHWPRHTFDVAVDNRHLSGEFEKSLRHAYQHGQCIYFADEVYGMIAELDGLEDDLIALWSRGGGMGAGLWTATQRPAGSQGHGVPGHMYSNTTHLFLSRDPDKRSRQRYGEIGGVDPAKIEEAVLNLRRYEFLYVLKADEHGGPYFAVVEAS
jgi:hypothetical protein